MARATGRLVAVAAGGFVAAVVGVGVDTAARVGVAPRGVRVGCAGGVVPVPPGVVAVGTDAAARVETARAVAVAAPAIGVPPDLGFVAMVGTAGTAVRGTVLIPAGVDRATGTDVDRAVPGGRVETRRGVVVAVRRGGAVGDRAPDRVVFVAGACAAGVAVMATVVRVAAGGPAWGPEV